MGKRDRNPDKNPKRQMDSARMLAKWSDPEYREKVKADMREKWKDDNYRAMIFASKGIPTPENLREATAQKYEMAAATIRLDAEQAMKQVALLEYQASIIRSGGEIPKDARMHPRVKKALHQMKSRKVEGLEKTGTYKVV